MRKVALLTFKTEFKLRVVDAFWRRVKEIELSRIVGGNLAALAMNELIEAAWRDSHISSMDIDEWMRRSVQVDGHGVIWLNL